MNLLLAIGHPSAENAIKNKLPSTCRVVEIAVYREQILTVLGSNPSIDAVLVRENLAGKTDIGDLVLEIRNKFPKVRIILMTGPREVGDQLLSEVVSYGVWDIIVGHTANLDVIIDHILKPRNFSDVSKYQIRTHTQETSTKTKKEPKESPQTQPQQEEELKKEEVEEKQKTPIVEKPLNTDLFKPIRKQIKQDVTKEVVKDISETLLSEEELEFVVEPEEEIIPEIETEISIPKSMPLPKVQRTINNNQTQTQEKQTQKEKSIQPKILSRLDIDSIKKPLVEKRRAINTEIKNSPIIMSLIGFKGGVGTTQVALNLAIELAKNRNKVLYVELNDHSIPFTFLYQLNNVINGLEKALDEASSESLSNVSTYINRMRELKKTNDKELSPIYNKYPDSLDFIAFSQLFVSGENHEYHPEGLNQLLVALLLQEGYQYIILDVNIHSHPTLVNQALKSSKYIFSVMTQDMLSVAQSVERLNNIHKKVMSLSNKLYFIVNRYDNDCISDKAILRWANNEMPLKVMGAWTVPEVSKQIYRSNDNGQPLSIASPPKEWARAFETMHNILKTM